MYEHHKTSRVAFRQMKAYRSTVCPRSLFQFIVLYSLHKKWPDILDMQKLRIPNKQYYRFGTLQNGKHRSRFEHTFF